MTTAPAAFRIHVPDRVLDDLQVRLQRTRWSRMGEVPGWELGTDREALRDLVEHWRTDYDWRAHEAQLNELLPQRVARAHGVDVHFVHVAARRPRALPLVLLHGWPDSFLRYRKVVRELALDFEVIVPSLPGFAFTGPVALPAVQPARYVADIVWHLIRDVLGVERFAIAGGDRGGVIAQILAIDHPENVVGIHLTDLGGHVATTDPATVTHAERRWLEANKPEPRPRGMAAALVDSPVGLASCILDRFHALGAQLDHDELLTNIMLYWATNTIGSSMLGDVAERSSPSLSPTDYVTRPVALALSAHDPGGIPPRRLAERTLDVVRWTEMRAGQLVALEEPERYASDVREFFRTLRERRETRKELRDDRPTI
jgi:pimeloyl-ACP methyl ester carboxylesterase